MNWAKIAIPALALLVGAGGTAAGLSLTGSGFDTSAHEPTSASQRAGSPGTGSGGLGGGPTGGRSDMMGGAGGMMGRGSAIAPGAPGGLVPASRMQALARQIARQATRSGQTHPSR